MEKHEIIMSDVLEIETIQEKLFPDFKGVIKSLGAWGGDFVMAISKDNPKDYFKEKGYQLFYFDDDDHKFYLGAIKSNDEMDILRWRGTNGINYDHTNQDIINKLEEWGKENPVRIVGVSFDWILFNFEHPVKDVEQLAKEVYDFCPDVVEQGVGTMDELKHFIKKENGIYLWWD